MAVRIQFRRGTAAEWTAANPTLAAGEAGYETDTAKFKLGTGNTAWNSLAYAGVNQSDIEDAVEAVIGGAPGALDTLNELAAALDDDANFASTITNLISNHAITTTNVHGISNTANLVYQNQLTSVSSQVDAEAERLDDHLLLTTNVHGISNTANLVYQSQFDAEIETLTTNKAPLDGPSFTGTVVLPSTTSIGDVSATEIGYLNNVTSAIQTQLNAKANIANAEFTGSTTLPADTSIGNVSAAEISYLNNVTSAIQTQLDGKLATSVASTTYAALTGATFTGTVSLTANTSIGSVDSTELGYLNGLTSNVQNQLNAKADESDVNNAIALKADSENPEFTVSVPALGPSLGFNIAQTVGPGEGQAIANEYDGGLWVNFSGDIGTSGTFPTFPNNTIVTIFSSDPATSQLNGFNWRVDTTLTALTSGSSYSWQAVLMPVTRTSASDAAVAEVSFLGDPWSNYYGTFTATVYEVVSQNVTVTQELGYLDNVTSNIQTQLTSKAALVSPTFSGNVVLPSTTTIGDVSATEIGYLNNVSSAIQTQLDAKLNLSGGTLTGALTLAGAPTSDLHAATKQYVDGLAAGINFHQPVVAATTGNLAGTYNNGTNGVGATLTRASNGAIGTIDGATVSVGSRILLRAQTDKKENGVYTVTAVGSGSAPWVITRATDADNNPSGELSNGDFVFTTSGSTNGSKGFIVSTTGTITIGTTEIEYAQFNASEAVIAGDGITKSGETISIAANSVTSAMIANGTIVDGDISSSAAIAQSKISGLTSDLAARAPLASPTFTGLVTVAANGIAFADGTQTAEGVPSRTVIIQRTSSNTLSGVERDDLIEMSNTSATTLTIPADSTFNFPVGTSIDVLQTNTGQVTIAGAGGVTVNATPGLKLRTQWSSATLFKRAANTWVVYGDLTA